MNTERLIDTLAHNVAPARPLAGPWTRSARWLLGTLGYFAALLLTTASIPEVAANARGGLFVFQLLVAVSTAAAAATAALALTVPGHPATSLRLVTITAFVWVASVGLGATREWAQSDINLVASGELACIAFIIFGGAFPGLAIARMLRRGAPLSPRLTAGLAALATTALASLTACVSRPHPSDAVTLAWHGSAILVLVAIAAAAGRAVLTWNTRTARSGATVS